MKTYYCSNTIREKMLCQEKMRKIKYKDKSIENYHTYIDIGSCEKNFENLPLYKEESISYGDWFSEFISCPLGVQMLTIHYYFLQYTFGAYLPETLYGKIKESKDLLNSFNKIWFEEDAPFFKGLDLNWGGINDDIEDKIENEEGYIKQVIFKNGSTICFLDDDNTLQSFYVKEIEYEKLKQEFDTILELLK